MDNRSFKRMCERISLLTPDQCHRLYRVLSTRQKELQVGVDDPEVYWECETGHLNQLETKLLRRVGAYSSWSKSAYIGITNNPERRAKQTARKYPGRWRHLIVLWRTSSRNQLRKAESMLVARTKAKIENERAGGGGPNSDRQWHYLYILLR